MAAYNLVKTVVTGDIIAASDRNTEHQNHINNNTVTGVTGDSSSVGAMQTVVDPYPASVESLATDLKGELERQRYVLKAIHGGAQWYVYPATNALLKGGGTMSGAIAMGSNKVTGLAAATTSGDALRYEQLFGGDVTLTGNLIFSPTTKGVKGTTTNNSAEAGDVGEYVSATVAEASRAITGTTGVYTDVTSISLTAGDWDVSVLLGFEKNGATGDTTIIFGVSTTSGNSSTGLTVGDTAASTIVVVANTGFGSAALPAVRMSLSATTTVYFKGQSTFLTACPKVYGRISARRVR